MGQAILCSMGLGISSWLLLMIMDCMISRSKFLGFCSIGSMFCPVVQWSIQWSNGWSNRPIVGQRSWLVQWSNARSDGLIVGPMFQWWIQWCSGRSNGPMVGPMVQWSIHWSNGWFSCPMLGPRVQWSVQWSIGRSNGLIETVGCGWSDLTR